MFCVLFSIYPSSCMFEIDGLADFACNKFNWFRLYFGLSISHMKFEHKRFLLSYHCFFSIWYLFFVEFMNFRRLAILPSLVLVFLVLYSCSVVIGLFMMLLSWANNPRVYKVSAIYTYVCKTSVKSKFDININKQKYITTLQKYRNADSP